MNKIDWSEKSIFRKIIIIMSALQVVAFFALPYARMNSAVGSLNSLANSFGASTGIPNNLTGFAAVSCFKSLCRRNAGWRCLCILCGIICTGSYLPVAGSGF